MKKLLPLFNGPSRYLGTEPGSIHKDPATVRARLALAFPDLYEVGMSYLGQKILYGIVNKRDGFWAERAFAPDEEVATLLRGRGEPLCTLESDTPLKDMDAIAFHVTHELCYTNILYMLDLGGIPLEASGRAEDDPIIMAGGGCTFNAEPIAAFMDVMVLGDGEEVLPAIMEHIAAAREAGTPRAEIVASMRAIPGVYVPSLFDTGEAGSPAPLLEDYPRVEKRIVADMEACEFPTAHVVPYAGAVHDRLAVEIARGCTRGCRFCQAGVIYRPARERSPETLDKLIAKGLEETGYEDLSFLSLSTGDHSGLEELFTRSFERCRAEQVAISLPSLRVGSVSERVMGLMASIRRTGATLAPEAGSQRLRDVINKGVTEEALVTHVRKLFDRGWQQVKLYFMLGLPTETQEDLAAIADLCLKVRDCAGPKVKRLQVTAAVSPFVPKPHTPFQWERQLTMEEVRERVDYLRDLFYPHKRLKLRWHMPEMSWLEGVFSRGDRRLAPVVRKAFEKGALFTSWKDHLRLEPWREVFAEGGIDPEAYLAERDVDGPLPWDHLSCGVTKRFLATERRRALSGTLTDDCRYNACRNCGVCNFEGRVSELAVQAASTEIKPRVAYESRDQMDAEGGSAHQTTPDAAAVPVAEAPESTAPVAAPAKQPKGGGKPKPPDIGELSDKACHYRIWHTKLGELRYISQIELQTLIERIMRRAKVPVSFSAGFHPLPRVSFGRALPVGVSSEREWFNVFLRKPIDPKALAERLLPQLPMGFDLLSIETLSMGKKQPQPKAEDFRLEFLLPAEEAEKRQAEWEAALAVETIELERVNKKGKVSVWNLRPFIVRAEPGMGRAVALRMDWSERYISPLKTIDVVNPGMAPDEFLLTKVDQYMELPAK